MVSAQVLGAFYCGRRARKELAMLIRTAGPEFVRGNADERRQLLKHIGWCMTELTALRHRLTKIDI